MINVYHNDWSVPDYRNLMGRAALAADFEIDEASIEGAEMLFASYTNADYSGDAFVLFRNDGKLFEVIGSHCSCYGLEGQWAPEETTAEAILKGIDGRIDLRNESTSKQLRYTLETLQ